LAGVANGGFAWTGIWSLLGKIFGGHKAFWGHAVTAGAGAFLYVTVSAACGWAAFALGLSGPVDAVRWVLTGLVAAGALRAHLHRSVVPSPRRATLLAAALAAGFWTLAGASAYFTGQKFTPAPRFDVRIKPAWARLARPAKPARLVSRISDLVSDANDLADKK
jgi:hypothetical protein